MKVKVNGEWKDHVAFVHRADDSIMRLLTDNVTEIDIPDNAGITKYAFYYRENLKKVSFGLGSLLGTNVFDRCSRLTDVTIREGTKELYNFTFQYCTSLREVELPISLKSFGTGGNFSYCSALERVAFKGDYNGDVNQFCFRGCTSLKEVDFSHCTSVVRNSSTNTFQNVPTTCEIRVPASLYDAWTKATNWSAMYAQGYNFVAV